MHLSIDTVSTGILTCDNSAFLKIIHALFHQLHLQIHLKPLSLWAKE